MHYTITGRHIKVTKALKQHIDEKLIRLKRFAIKMTEVHIVLSVERDRHIAEILLVGKKLSISSKAQTTDMYTSFDIALDLLEERIIKYMDKKLKNRLRLMKKTAQRTKAKKEKKIQEDVEINL
ncbi:MAG: ribosome-associated translation inhibitor RaiA [Candidatus Omnitrophota bacterium]